MADWGEFDIVSMRREPGGSSQAEFDVPFAKLLRETKRLYGADAKVLCVVLDPGQPDARGDSKGALHILTNMPRHLLRQVLSGLLSLPRDG